MADSVPNSVRRLVGAAILVVDDDELVRKVATAMLARLGALPCVVNGGREALETLARADAKIDAVLLDLVMPDLDGVATLREIRRLRPALPVVICSGGAGAGPRQLTADLGEQVILEKPFALAALEKALESALR